MLDGRTIPLCLSLMCLMKDLFPNPVVPHPYQLLNPSMSLRFSIGIDFLTVTSTCFILYLKLSKWWRVFFRSAGFLGPIYFPTVWSFHSTLYSDPVSMLIPWKYLKLSHRYLELSNRYLRLSHLVFGIIPIGI